MYVLEGKPIPKKIRISIVASRFDGFITSKLPSSTLGCLRRHEVSEDAIIVIRVPGAFKTSPIASHMALSRRYDTVIYPDVVIRGGTSHYDYVYSEVSKGITQTSLTIEAPITFGVLTMKDIKQAIERAGTKAGNKGYGYTAGAIEMVNLIHGFCQRTADDSLSAMLPVQDTDP